MGTSRWRGDSPAVERDEDDEALLEKASGWDNTARGAQGTCKASGAKRATHRPNDLPKEKKGGAGRGEIYPVPPPRDPSLCNICRYTRQRGDGGFTHRGASPTSK